MAHAPRQYSNRPNRPSCPSHLLQSGFDDPQWDFVQKHGQNGAGAPENWDNEDHEGEESEESEEEEEMDEDVEYDEPHWGRDPKNLKKLEELRWTFRSELKDPSAWTLERIKALTGSDSGSVARRFMVKWRTLVAQSTKTPEGVRLRLPDMGRPQDMPFHRVLTWGEIVAQKFPRGWEVEERYKQAARRVILFLFPEARTKGLSVGEKDKLITIASNIWLINCGRAEGFLWVLRKDYAYDRVEANQGRKWANSMAEDFMSYTALYPPPTAVFY